jgi:hypothetical protein
MGIRGYYDLARHLASRNIDLLFPNWRAGDERVLVLSPHDDDALLGAGYAMHACQAEGAEVYVCILCDGRAGYSLVEERDNIVQVRVQESLRAYAAVGLDAQHVVHLGYPDFSLRSFVGLQLDSGREGVMRTLVTLMRRARITRLLIPNGYREHSDHQAGHDVGRYDGVQAGDPVAVDWGTPSPLKSTLEYAVWGDFAPEDALVHRRDPRIRANRAIVVEESVEQAIASALAEWHSQQQIIAGLLQARRQRECAGGLLELYIAFDPRPVLDYGPYAALVGSMPLS